MPVTQLDPKSALIVVDLQKGIVGPEEQAQLAAAADILRRISEN